MTYKVGDVVEITEHLNGHDFAIGEHVTLTAEYYAGTDAHFFDATDKKETWAVEPTEFKPVEVEEGFGL